MKIDSPPHGLPGLLVSICGFDGSGKTTLEEALLAALTPTRPCVATWAPTRWWRDDANARRTLFGEGHGSMLSDEALLHFILADCHAYQANVILPALARSQLVISNRYLFDMLALLEARGMTMPAWATEAAASIVRPDVSFVLNGSAAVFVDRVICRDGFSHGRFDQDVQFVERYNASLMRMAQSNGLTVLLAEASPGDILRQCLTVLMRT